MNKTYKRLWILVSLVVFLIVSLINGELVITNILEYTNIFFTKLFPVSFLFFIISSLFIDYGLIELLSKLLKVNTAKFYVFLLSLISGFPSGSKYTKELLEKDLLSIEEANSVIKVAHFPNPLFVLGTLNGILQDKGLCLKILGALILSNFLLFCLLPTKKGQKIETKKDLPKDFTESLSKAILGAFRVMIIIYGTSLFFNLISSMICHYLTLDIYSYVIINGLCDLTKGIASLPLISNKIVQANLALIFLAFGGISIHMQTKSILLDTPISYKEFFKGRIWGTLLAVIILLILISF